ncbi:MAG: Sialidase precursor [Planctomycetes bacterium ADurb.Bin126]|nr:MAG: Sialidase precursor [Planctomycetes bacterium ADurb.Bin126]HQL73711.1 discoidin domain-containing protein [Phycisphaerae bacterium]
MIIRLSLFLCVLCLIASPALPAPQASCDFQSWFPNGQRTWVGPDFWANRLQDWQVANGRLECLGRLPLRTVHLLTRRLSDKGQAFEMTVRLGRTGPGTPADALAGFLIGAGGDDLDYRSAALVHHSPGPGGGLIAAVNGLGRCAFIDNAGGRGKSRRAGALDRDGWKVLRVDSQEAETPASNMLDGNAGTIWHSRWKDKKVGYPHEVLLDLGKATTFHGVAVLPRQDSSVGRIKEYEVYAGANAKEWGKPLAQGQWSDTNDEQTVPLPETTARYVRLVARSGVTDRPACVIAELNLLAKPVKPAQAPKAAPAPKPSDLRDIELRLAGKKTDDGCELTLTVRSADGAELSSAKLTVAPGQLPGSLALICTAGGKDDNWWFKDWTLTGDAVRAHGERALGPILSTQYVATAHALTRQPRPGENGPVMRMNVQMMPLGRDDNQTVRLEVREGEQWKDKGLAKIVTPGHIAVFTCGDWDLSRDWPYRVVYELKQAGGTARTCTWEGTVRRDPVDQETIVVAGFTGNHNSVSGVERPNFPWAWGVWFPHADITSAIARHKADLLFFSGDQVYEGASPTRPEPHELDYLYKWYLWCWAYRDLTREIPCVIEPDDHDVYQGNLWGQGGRKTAKDDKGGYVYDAEFVKTVERTQSAHHIPYDPTPVEQGIGVYYGAFTWGRIGVAVIEDRKFKSGCNGLVPPTDTKRADHVQDPNFDPKRADVPGAELLGKRQEEFLADWAGDWKAQDMKLMVSQTTLAGMATHHGGGLQRLRIDYDSNGWPQSGRARALRELRKGFAFHLCGDQHLASIVHQGLEDWNDSIYSFCVPSVANFYPRMWKPDVPGKNRNGLPEHLGEHLDGLGNKVTVYAVTNPDHKTGHEPAALHDRMPGYGIVRFNRRLRTITIECWPRCADPGDPAAKQYPGWPKVIRQEDNYARKPAGHLATLKLPPVARAADNPAVKVIDEKTGELISAIRPAARTYRPKVFDADKTYTVRLVWDDGKTWQKTGLKAAGEGETIEVK